MSSAVIEQEQDVQHLRVQLDNAKQIFERQSRRLEELEHECDEAGIARDKALYWLLRFCDVAEQEHWTMREDVGGIHESATQLLFEHNIFTGLPEPDHAILRLMEIAAPACSCPQDCDCEKPPTHLSNECPIHNENPLPCA